MGNANRSGDAATRNRNRLGALMVHIGRYQTRGTSRLAADARVSKATVSQIIHGKSHPLYSTALRVVKALEHAMGRPLGIEEVFSEDGTYPTPFVCDLFNCCCLPACLYSRDNRVLPAFVRVLTGQWSGDVFEFRTFKARPTEQKLKCRERDGS